MNTEAEKLLMMFVKDGYKSQTGKVSKKTAIAMMKFVANNHELRDLVNSSDWKGVLNHKLTKELK